MAAIDNIVSVTITTDTQVPSRAGFGTPMLAAYHTNNTDRVRQYRDPSELLTDGFTVKDWVYYAAAKMWSQRPQSRKFKAGRRALPYTQTVELTPIITTQGYVYTIVVTSPDGTETTVTKTNGASEKVATIVAALQSGLTATDVGPGTV